MYDPSHTGLGWTDGGDLLQTADYRLKKVRGFNNFIRRIMFLLRTEPNTYLYDPSVGVGLARFAGRVNNVQTRDEIQKTIEDSLLDHDVTYPYVPSVTVSSLDRDSIRVSISLIGEGLTEHTSLALNIKNGQIKPITGLSQTLRPREEPEPDPGSKAEPENDNKYLSRK